MEQRLRFFENRMLRKIFGAEREEVIGREQHYIIRRVTNTTLHQMSFGR